MADERQRSLLYINTKKWNSRRKQYPTDIIDLSGADLSSVDLSGADLSSAILNSARLGGAKLSGADLSSAILNSANLYGANLSRADLREADLSRADLRGADLRGTDLSGANLSDARFSEVLLSRANLSEANLSNAKFSEVELNEANLSRAILNRTNLSRVNLKEADLSEANLSGAIFDDIDLRTIKGLKTIFHLGPSIIATSTLERSEGDIPEIFLKGAGLSDTFISYIRSLVQSPIQYYTCFISYSSKDQEFAERLYADLQNKNVRCWYAPEDLKIGEKFWHRIDESIRLYDKLLVILSHHSVQSEWVEREATAALEKEKRQQTLVLFPISVDESFKDTLTPWASDVRRNRHIGDFRHWKDHDQYQQAFARLLRDLKADSSKPKE
jgi:uncharacterized protein YjbI with pentapeptide repeats